MLQRDAVGDEGEALLLGLLVTEGLDPVGVQRGPGLGDDDGVDADGVLHEGSGPLAGEAEDGTLGGGVGRGLALAGEGHLGGDVHDGTLGLLEVRAGLVNELEVVGEVAVQGLLEVLPAGGLELEVVVAAGVVHDAVDVAVLLVDLLDDGLDGVGVVEVDVEHLKRVGDLGDLGAELVLDTVLAVQDHGHSALAGELQGDALADALEAAGDEDNLALEMQIHGSSLSLDARYPGIYVMGPKGVGPFRRGVPSAFEPRLGGRPRVACGRGVPR